MQSRRRSFRTWHAGIWSTVCPRQWSRASQLRLKFLERCPPTISSGRRSAINHLVSNNPQVSARCSRVLRSIAAAAILLTVAGFRTSAVEPIHYRFSFPAREHHWMQVEAAFTGLGASPLELRMSRSSPGRYSVHDFAKNVYDVHAFAADGRELTATQPDAYGWNVAGHGGAVKIKYKVYGDRVDGTYLAVDVTHAH